MTTSRTLTGLLVASLLAMALVFGITISNSDAQEQKTCPEGTTLSADGETCLTPAVDDNVVTTTSCTVGVLSDDGQSCIVPRLDAEPPAAPAPADAPAEAPVPSFTG